MKSMDTGDASEEEITEAITTLAFRMGREPFTFYDIDGDPWATLVRADDYQVLVAKAEQLDLLQALVIPSVETRTYSHQE